jgi:acetylornithine deacetylase/succinyl-diaminopimelate desuccinylase-like protein
LDNLEDQLGLHGPVFVVAFSTIPPTFINMLSKISSLFLGVFLSISFSLFAQKKKDIDLESVTEKNLKSGIGILNDLISIPNDSNIPEQLWPNLEWCERNFADRGWKTQRLETAGFPLMLAEMSVPKATKTVLFYFHVDGQPVNAKQWEQEDPFGPVLKQRNSAGKWETIPMSRLDNGFDPEWRIFARSSSDDKGPLAMFLTAWDALKAEGKSPNYNVKVILDFEEEIGSPHLGPAVRLHKEKLAADMMLIMDGPRHISNEPTLTFGARGIAEITLTVYGPRNDQHSGHYGNYAPNPAFRLSQLLSSMKDDEGRVVIPGFYDGITLTAEEKRIWRLFPMTKERLENPLG